MSHTITFYPLGNADTSLLELSNGKKILFDYANMKTDDEDDKRVDLPAELDKVLDEAIDVGVFTHADEDHVKGFSEYFYLEHDSKYQGKGRKKINDLWVPAAILIQKDSEIKHDDGKILKKEARYRLKNKARIKVFSKPDKLKDWLKGEGIAFEEVKHLLVDAGTIVPGWAIEKDGVEFFVHSPFASHIDDKKIERNEACLILQGTFDNSKASKVIFGADADSDLIGDIVDITKHFKKEDRMKWDIFHLCHHCSYKAINKADRGGSKTVPTEQVKWLFETQGNKGAILISPSHAIPEANEEIQPPHKECHLYYKDIEELVGGHYKVTMEHPSKENPEPLVVVIDDNGVTLKKHVVTAGFASNKPAPRAG